MTPRETRMTVGRDKRDCEEGECCCCDNVDELAEALENLLFVVEGHHTPKRWGKEIGLARAALRRAKGEG